LDARLDYGSPEFEDALRDIIAPTHSAEDKSPQYQRAALIAALDGVSSRLLSKRALAAGATTPAVDAALEKLAGGNKSALRELVVDSELTAARPSAVGKGSAPPAVPLSADGLPGGTARLSVPPASLNDAPPSNIAGRLLPGAIQGQGPVQQSTPAVPQGSGVRAPLPGAVAEGTKTPTEDSKLARIAKLKANRVSKVGAQDLFSVFESLVKDHTSLGREITVFFLGYSHQMVFYCLKSHGIVDDRGDTTRTISAINGVAKYGLGARCRLLGKRQQQSWISTAVGPGLDESIPQAFIDRTLDIAPHDKYGDEANLRGVSVAGRTADVLYESACHVALSSS
jgi:hypothetical protein